MRKVPQTLCGNSRPQLVHSTRLLFVVHFVFNSGGTAVAILRNERSSNLVMKKHGRLIYTLNFSEISLKDINRVGGKNASLGELFNYLKPKGIGVIDGFAATADAYRALLAEGQLEYELRSLVTDFDYEDV